jgi:hypothetical protein
MARVRLRWWGWLGVATGVLLVYLLALSLVPRWFDGGEAEVDRGRAKRALAAENWALVVPEDRAELTKAVDQAWRSLTAYRQEYRAGTPGELAADTPAVRADSAFNLTKDHRVAAQKDVNIISATAPGGGGREQRQELYRVLTDRPYVNAKGRRVGDSELIYQQAAGGWACTRDVADKRSIPVPGLALADAGDAGFAEIDGHRVRGFVLAGGAFGLRQPATVWVDTESLWVRRQEIESAVRGQREIWTYGGFDEQTAITPPAGVTCVET